MAEINDSTKVLAPLSPGGDTANTFGTHDARFGIGGFQRVSTTIERDAISEDRRPFKVVYVDSEQKFYYFDTSNTSTWKELSIQGVGGGTGGTARSDEEIQDLVASMFARGSHEGVSIIYDDNTGTFHVRLHGGASTSTVWIDPNVDLSPPTPADGSFGKPYSSLTAAVPHLTGNADTIQSVASGSLSGVHDFRGKTGDIHIWAPNLNIGGSILLDADYTGTIYVTCNKYTAIASLRYAIQYIELGIEGSFNTNKRIQSSAGMGVHGNLSVHHGYGTTRHDVYNEVRWVSYNRDGSFTYPADGMKFYTKKKEAAYLMAGVSNDSEWNAIVDHDTEDYTQWALATKITTGSNREAVIEDHGFDDKTNEWYVFVWYHDGTAQGVTESYQDIAAWLLSKRYTTTLQAHNTGDGIFEQDVHVYGNIFNDALEHSIHSVDTLRPGVAAEAQLSRLYVIPPNAPFGSLVRFDSVQVEDESVSGGFLTAPFKGAYSFTVSMKSANNATTTGGKCTLVLTPDGSDEHLEDATSHKICKVESTTAVGEPMNLYLKRTVLLEQGDTVVVKFINSSTENFTFNANENPTETFIQIDSHNASQLSLAKITNRLDAIEASFHIDSSWRLVIDNQGTLTRRRRPV